LANLLGQTPELLRRELLEVLRTFDRFEHGCSLD
jgi:hypothetical protein